MSSRCIVYQLRGTAERRGNRVPWAESATASSVAASLPQCNSVLKLGAGRHLSTLNGTWLGCALVRESDTGDFSSYVKSFELSALDDIT